MQTKSKNFDFTINASLRKKVPRPNVDEINGVPSYMTPHACTQDPRFFSHKLLSKSFEIKPQLMMAAATARGYLQLHTWTSSHRLGIETGRWRRPVLPREQRKCPRCNKIDDEYHFLLECCILKDLRTQLIPAYYWKRPSMFKCIQLLNSSVKTLNKLAKYVHRCFMLKSWIAMLVTIFGLPWFMCMLCCMYSVLLYRL